MLGSIDQRHAGLASGIMFSTFQIGAALGVAIVGGVFFSLLSNSHELAAYCQAFSVALGCNVALLMLGGLLSLLLSGIANRTGVEESCCGRFCSHISMEQGARARAP